MATGGAGFARATEQHSNTMLIDGVDSKLPGEQLAIAIAEHWTSHTAEALIQRVFQLDRRVSVVSSFGAEAAVLLSLVADHKPDAEIIFIDTLRHFGETHRYRDAVAGKLGLTNIRIVKPKIAPLFAEDPDEMLFRRNPDRCCELRKVEPLRDALLGTEIWMTGRKRFQSETRSKLEKVEFTGGRIKINPLADWTQDEIVETFRSRGLPAHPLEADGFLSIGCMPCTKRVAPGENHRGGRWEGFDKTECGIHNDV